MASSFVPGSQFDVFISYAHVDNVPPTRDDVGWVTGLVNSLRTELGRKLGRPDAFSLWFDDQRLSGNGPLTPAIRQSLEGTALLVTVLSQGYFASDWCRREREAFLARCRPGGSVFPVSMERLSHEQRSLASEDLKGYDFWVEDERDRQVRTLGYPRPAREDLRYYQKVEDLARELANELRARRGAAAPTLALTGQSRPGQESADPCPVASAPRSTVFLAEATDDIDEARDQVKRYLDQAGIRVVPERNYPRTPAEFRTLMERDVPGSAIFAQLLGPTPGKLASDLPRGYAGLQFETAVSAGVPVLQWRSRDLDPRRIADPDYRRLLEGEHVHAVDLEEFKATLVERATRARMQKPPAPGAFVFVDVDGADRALAEAVREIALRRGFSIFLPLTGGAPADIRKDLERSFIECQLLIVIYGASAPSWVREQLMFLRRVMPKRERSLPAIALYEGPPAEKVPLDAWLPNMQVLNCRKSIDESALLGFLDRNAGVTQ